MSCDINPSLNEGGCGGTLSLTLASSMQETEQDEVRDRKFFLSRETYIQILAPEHLP
jgi:hypothetical protein